jgi:hypothetical protein
VSLILSVTPRGRGSRMFRQGRFQGPVASNRQSRVQLCGKNFQNSAIRLHRWILAISGEASGFDFLWLSTPLKIFRARPLAPRFLPCTPPDTTHARYLFLVSPVWSHSSVSHVKRRSHRASRRFVGFGHRSRSQNENPRGVPSPVASHLMP